jgi:hypothetical protein
MRGFIPLFKSMGRIGFDKGFLKEVEYSFDEGIGSGSSQWEHTFGTGGKGFCHAIPFAK